MAGVAGRFEKDKVRKGAVYFLNELVEKDCPFFAVAAIYR
jgi:hypothetical protein